MVGNDKQMVSLGTTSKGTILYGAPDFMGGVHSAVNTLFSWKHGYFVSFNFSLTDITFLMYSIRSWSSSMFFPILKSLYDGHHKI